MAKTAITHLKPNKAFIKGILGQASIISNSVFRLDVSSKKLNIFWFYS
ncbi:hypothetical protein FPK15_contig00094-0007 [Flavobacterium psychrophilum]|nr:hypothetical protein FPK15_contig00094-0007 [Flavobacterium psychrophilum]